MSSAPAISHHTPLFRAGNGWTRKPWPNAMTSMRISEPVKRRLKDAGRAAGGLAIPGRARGAANDRIVRPAAAEESYVKTRVINLYLVII